MRVALEVELLQVGAAATAPTRVKNSAAQHASEQRRRVRVWLARPALHSPTRVEEGVEDEAAPAELEADPLGHEVVGVEVDLLEDEVLDEKKVNSPT